MRTKLLAIVWVAAICAVSGWFIASAANGPVINANLMALLSKTERDPVVYDVVKRVEKRFERHITLLVGAQNFDIAKAAAQHVSKRLRDSKKLQSLRVDDYQALGRRAISFYLPLRFALLGNEERDQLQAGNVAAFEQSVLKQYYSPKTTLNSQLIDNDPLLLMPRFLEERATNSSGRPQIEDGYLTVKSDGNVYIVLIGELDGSPFSFALQQQFMPVLDALRSELQAKFEGAGILISGVLPHAAAGTDSAISEMSTVGLGSLLGIIAMLIAMFRSPSPFILTLLSIALGCLGGFAACLAVFGEVHLLTLVFGASLVGISVDYSLHFFCERFRFEADWLPREAVRHIFPGVTLGLITSVIGFVGLFFAPFPGMQGMAVFSSVGLCIAYGCVVICYPAFANKLTAPRIKQPLVWAHAYAAFWDRRPDGRVSILVVLFALAAIFGCLKLVANDDVRLLQAPDVIVMAEETRTRTLVGKNLGSQFFLVEGQTVEEFLEREEQLTEKLRKLQKDAKLAGYLAISDYIPSPLRQKENRALLASVITGEKGALDNISQKVGLPARIRDTYRNAFLKAQDKAPVGFETWLTHSISEPYRHLWLGRTARGVAGVVGLRGAYDLSALQEAADTETFFHFVDPAGDISNLFGDYRRQTIWLTLISYGVVMLLLIARYGFRGGLTVMAPPVIAAIATLSALGFLGEAISLFNVMGLLLVLGIGVDYALFFRETGADNPSTLLAIALSSLTTLLAFGLLALSATTAIHSFGITILIGILFAFILSPMAGWQRPVSKMKRAAQ